MFTTEEEKQVLIEAGHNVKTASELGIETLELFADTVRERLGVEYEQVNCYISDIQTSVCRVNASGRFEETKPKCAVFSMMTDCFRLDLIQHNQKCVEIYWIETFDRCKGQGTDIMNTILDVADEQQIDVRAIPADIASNGDHRLLVRLRDWYRSFGFVAGKLQKEVFIYKCQPA